MARPTRHMKPYCVYFTYDQLQKLSKLTTKTRIPIAAYVREAIVMLLDKYADIIEQDADKIIIVTKD